MKRARIVMLSLYIGIGMGCTLAPEPRHDTGFHPTRDLQSLAGCYRNRAEGNAARYLSAVIWPGERFDHEMIAIEVIYDPPRDLRVTGLGPSGPVKQTTFVAGRDFVLESGQIELRSDTITSLAYPADNPFIGAGHHKQVLGLDEHGDGRLEENITFAGTAFLVIPVAGNSQDVYRFARQPGLCARRP